MTDPKLQALKTAIKRVSSRIHRPGILLEDGTWLAPWNPPGARRFVALWQARNRRTRILMFRQRDKLLAQ